MITIQSVSKKFDSIQAVHEVNLSIKEGELFGVIGPDGAGKTTLFRMVNSLIIPDSGQIDLWGLNPVDDYKKVRQMIGYMPGKFSLYEDLTIEENLEFFATVFGTTIEENYHLIKDIYQQIEPFKMRPAGKLSGGMKQKLALCCALIHSPKLLVLDEPTTGVDVVSRHEFWEMLNLLKQRGITILVSTPYMDDAQLCDRVALMQKGEILNIDTPDNIQKSFDKKLWGIKSGSFFSLVKDLRAYPSAYSVFSFGEYVHYTDNEELKNEQLINYLKAKGHADIELIELQPTIEDCFMDLMTFEQ